MNAIAAVGSNREKQRERETEQSSAEIMARGVYLCVRARVLSRIICGTIKWGEAGFKTWCDQRGMRAGSRA